MTYAALAEYVCPKCGYFNPSARALREIKEGKKSRSPDGRSPIAQSAPASKSHFAPPIETPVTSAAQAQDERHAPTETDDGTNMDVDS